MKTYKEALKNDKNLPSYILERKKLVDADKKGSEEYNRLQNKINRAYRADKRHEEVPTKEETEIIKNLNLTLEDAVEDEKSKAKKAADDKKAKEEKVGKAVSKGKGTEGLLESLKDSPSTPPSKMKAKKKPSAKIQERNRIVKERRADRRSGALKQKRKDKRNTRRAERGQSIVDKANKKLDKANLGMKLAQRAVGGMRDGGKISKQA